jgi:dihydrodipicolinate synthase/N-acetylneuraminate lyase
MIFPSQHFWPPPSPATQIQYYNTIVSLVDHLLLYVCPVRSQTIAVVRGGIVV